MKRYAASSVRVLIYLLGGALFPGFVLGGLWALYLANPRRFPFELFSTPWDLTFSLGIPASLWVQCGIFLRFAMGSYFTATSSKGLIEIVNWTVAVLSCIAVFIALLGIHELVLHLGATVAYAFLVVVWDVFAIFSRPVKGHEHKHTLFRERSSELLRTTDLPILLVLSAWALLATYGFDVHRWEFYFSEEIQKQLQKVSQNSRVDMKSLVGDPRDMREPLIGGVVGFQMLLSVISLFFHLYHWEIQPVERKRATGGAALDHLE